MFIPFAAGVIIIILIILFLLFHLERAKLLFETRDVVISNEEFEIESESAHEGTEEVIYNVPLPCNDFTVILNEVRVRRNGIFLIVRKNRSGHIIGSAEDIYWHQMKNEQRKKMKNPIREARLHVFALSRALRNIGVHDWIHGVVVFDNVGVSLNIESRGFPVLKEDELSDYLTNFQESITDNRFQQITEWLKNTREMWGGERHD